MLEPAAQQVQTSPGNCGVAALCGGQTPCCTPCMQTAGRRPQRGPSVRVVNPCGKARSIQPTLNCIELTAASRKHQSLRLLREHHLLFQRTISIMRKSDGRSTPRHESVMTSPRRRPQVKRRWTLPRAHRDPTGSTPRMDPTLGTDEWILHTFITRTHSATRSHQQGSASFCQRVASHRFSSAPMSESSSSSWWEGWSGTSHGWHDSSPPDPTPTEQAPDEQVTKAVHRLQFRLQQMLALTQSRSQKNRDGTRHVGFQRQSCIRSHGGRCYGTRMAG